MGCVEGGRGGVAGGGWVGFFFQAEDGIRGLVRSRGLGDVYKRQELVANISHELKTPVGALGVLAETLAGEHDPDVVLSLIHI